MGEDGLTAAQHQLTAALDSLDTAAASAGDGELLGLLTLCETATRRLDRLAVAAIATLQQRGTFAEHGYRTPAAALGDLLGWERFEARRRVTAADQVHGRTGLDGTPLPARLPATAGVFAAGGCSLRHVETIARTLGTAAAGRLSPQVCGTAPNGNSPTRRRCTPRASWPAGPPPWSPRWTRTASPPTSGTRSRCPSCTWPGNRDGAGGSIRGRFADAAMFDAIAAVIDAKAKPLTGDDTRPAGRRQAEALAEVCGWVLDHADLPDCGGQRPHLNVLVRLEDLENRARSAMLDFGGGLSPATLRMLACDAAVIPIVLNGHGQPLDVGRIKRTIPDGLRRAVTARDRGCAYPGCDRPPSWCEIHHLHPWEHGGHTKLDNLVALCRQHHRLLHADSGWTVHIHDGLPEFLPPHWIDPHRRPRRKPHPHLVA